MKIPAAAFHNEQSHQRWMLSDCKRGESSRSEGLCLAEPPKMIIITSFGIFFSTLIKLFILLECLYCLLLACSHCFQVGCV